MKNPSHWTRLYSNTSFTALASKNSVQRPKIIKKTFPIGGEGMDKNAVGSKEGNSVI